MTLCRVVERVSILALSIFRANINEISYWKTLNLPQQISTHLGRVFNMSDIPSTYFLSACEEVFQILDVGGVLVWVSIAV